MTLTDRTNEMASKAQQTIFYARVSTTEQTIEHQEKQARAAGYDIDLVISDAGVSGVSVPLADRPEGKRLFDLLRRGDTLVVRWVDRLGRNYQDVTDTIREFMRRGVIIKTVINGLTFDGAATDPMSEAVRDALIGFMAATAQAQAEATKVAQRAGIDANKGNIEKYRGRKPSFTRDQLEVTESLLDQNMGDSAIAREVGLSRAAVIRIKNDRKAAHAAMEKWS
jgi:putative DNA-invertase from lambdoid prophage Rac